MQALLGVLCAAAMPFVIATLLSTSVGSIVLAVVIFGGIAVTVVMNLWNSLRVSVDLWEMPWRAFGKSGN